MHLKDATKGGCSRGNALSGGDRRGCSVTPPRAGRGRIAPERTESEAASPLYCVPFGTFLGAGGRIAPEGTELEAASPLSLASFRETNSFLCTDANFLLVLDSPNEFKFNE